MKILFLTDYWFPHKTANAICVENIIKALKKTGNECFVSAYYGGECSVNGMDGINFYFIKPTLSRRFLNYSEYLKSDWMSKAIGEIGKILNRLRRMILLPVYPVVSVLFSIRWSKQAISVIDKEKIDVVVTVNAPEDSTFTGYLIKKQCPQVKWVIYNIDAGSNLLPGSSFYKLKKLLQRKAIKWENKMIMMADRVIVMEGHSKYFLDNIQNKLKLCIADVPLLDISGVCDAPPQKSDSVITKWVYTGSLNGVHYDPCKVCEFFKEYSKLHKSELHLYGPSDHREFLTNIQNNIIWHGLVSHEEVVAAQKEADVLIYYKCSDLESVSGKLYEYLLRGKPIIYLGPKNDINSRRLSKYNFGIALDILMSPVDNARQAYGFLRQCSDCDSVFDVFSIKEIYKNSLPETTAGFLVDW